MRLHVLITPHMMLKKPNTTEIVMDWGQLEIIIENNYSDSRRGLHCFVEDTENNLQKWTDECDEFIKGSGSPQFESFKILTNGETE